MKSPLTAALLALAAAGMLGCQSFTRPTPDYHAALAAGIGEPLLFRTEKMPDHDPASLPTLLTLQTALHQMLQSDPALQAALAQVRVAEAESQQTRLLPNPILTLAFRIPEGAASPIINVSLAAELLALLQKPGQIQAADFRLRAASAQTLVAVLDSLSRLREKYAAAQALDALLPILQTRGKLLDQVIELTQSRLRAGEAIPLDLTTLQTQRAQLDVEALEHEAQRHDLRLQLARALGKPLDTAAWNLEPFAQPATVPADETALLRDALEHRPELQAQLWELSALGIEARTTWPALFDGTQVGIDAERDGPWSAGPSVAIPLPLFDWGQARRTRATALQLQALHQLTAQRQKIIEEVRTALHMLHAMREAHAALADRLLPLLESRRTQADAFFRAQGDAIPLILADQELYAARTKQIELQHKISDALIRLERAVGGPAHLPAITPATTKKE